MTKGRESSHPPRIQCVSRKKHHSSEDPGQHEANTGTHLPRVPKGFEWEKRGTNQASSTRSVSLLSMSGSEFFRALLPESGLGGHWIGPITTRLHVVSTHEIAAEGT